MKALFQVGEEVIIQGQVFKGFDGMTAIVTWASDRPANLFKRGYKSVYGFSYRTSLDTIRGLVWQQKSLRKKQDPSGKSLDEVISLLNKSKAAS